MLVLTAGLAAASIAWAAGESMMIEETGMGSKGGRTPIPPVVYITRNGMTSLGLLGASLGLGLGLAGGARACVFGPIGGAGRSGRRDPGRGCRDRCG